MALALLVQKNLLRSLVAYSEISPFNRDCLLRAHRDMIQKTKP